jgi:hypothetical protein
MGLCKDCHENKCERGFSLLQEVHRGETAVRRLRLYEGEVKGQKFPTPGRLSAGTGISVKHIGLLCGIDK